MERKSNDMKINVYENKQISLTEDYMNSKRIKMCVEVMRFCLFNLLKSTAIYFCKDI